MGNVYSRFPKIWLLLLATAFGGASGCSIVDKVESAASGSSQTDPSNRILSFVDGSSVNLGNIAVGATLLVRLSIATTGTGNATIGSTSNSSSNYTFNGGTFPGTGGTCTQPVQGNCSIAVLFTAPVLPGGVGIYSNVVSISYTSGGVSRSIAITLTATVTLSAALTINATVPYDFGNKQVGTTTYQTLTVLNTGTLAATSLTGSGLSAPLTFRDGTYPGTGGTCGNTLNASASCTIVIAFAPTVSGAVSQTLALNYTSGGTNGTNSLAIDGNGVDTALITITVPATDPHDFGDVVVGAAAQDVTITLSNGGLVDATSLAASGLAIPFTFKGGAYPGTGGDCGATLVSGATCDIVVSFQPVIATTSTDTLVITYDDGTTTQTLNFGLTGNGINPAILSISNSPTFDYGSRTVGTTTDQAFTVSNAGSSTATSIAEVAFTGPFDYAGGTFPGTGGTCSTSLVASANCTIVVSFSPLSLGGFSDTIDISYDNGIATVNATRAITGTGGSTANLTISDGATYSFGTVAVSYSADKTFTVTNAGSVAASAMSVSGLAAPFDLKGGVYPGTGGTCGATLGAGGTCTLVVTYSPTAAVGSTDTLILDYNDSVNTTSSTRDLSASGATITKVVGGSEHTCALYSSGVIKCWGSDQRGQLGNGGVNTDSTTPVLVSGITTATDISAGSEHTCAILGSGVAKCWGSDSNGQLGNDVTLADQSSPVTVATFSDFNQISAGGNVTCAVQGSGTTQCWGLDSEGANGDNASFVDNATPVTVAGLINSVEVAVGRQHACIHKSNGNSRCWGSDSQGQLGNGGADTNSGTMVQQSPAINTGVSAIAGGNTSCHIISDGSVMCWGSDSDGQLGDDGAFATQDVPVTVAGLQDATRIVLGMKHGCAINSGGSVDCWGDAFYGQVGDGGTTDQPTPVSVGGLSSVTSLGAGDYHSCAGVATGEVYCWGSNSSGQLGNGAVLTNETAPVQVLGL